MSQPNRNRELARRLINCKVSSRIFEEQVANSCRASTKGLD